MPPKDDRWLVQTVNLAAPHEEEEEPGFWDKFVQRITKSNAQPDASESSPVSISVPADAAIEQLGISSDDDELQAKRNYFKRMAARCKEKFDEDNKKTEAVPPLPPSSSPPPPPPPAADQLEKESHESEGGSEHHRGTRHLHRYLEALHRHFHHHHESDPQEETQEKSHAPFVPKVDPKEMEAAHRRLYHCGRESTEESKAEGRKLFGPWWGWHKRTHEEKELDKQIENEWEKVDFPRSSEEKQQSMLEKNGGTTTGLFGSSDWTWWKRNSSTESLTRKERKAITKRHQAIASAGKWGGFSFAWQDASPKDSFILHLKCSYTTLLLLLCCAGYIAAYEAVKEYHARKARHGKKVSHGEMKAMLAGMAMAEAIKLLESNHDDDDDDDDDKDETVAEAGSAALKLFELLK